ncbi:16S rRNA (guanine(527)-N(7))-methyltransferase RsmG [Oleidesulfovibrio sp.]|uniref:16S rRNA (guanine(527)-N(7))-methyltransferase RsmG n=1 Tax=Oleidesulfovibrio sp. TaxID=2909707 RepID=UPI003A8874F1
MAKKMSPAGEQQVAMLCSELGFTLQGEALKNITGYLNMLQKWSVVMNLVGPRSWEPMLRTLIVDSLHLKRFLETLDFSVVADSADIPMQIWDFGAGAGLPGIPLRMVWQEGEYHMVDVREKRTMFMQMVLAKYPLPATNVHRARVEDFMEGRAPAAMMVSRAFMPWPELLELLTGKIRRGGFVVVLANEPAPAHDVPDASHGRLLPEDWSLTAQYEYSVEGSPRYFWALSSKKAPN